MELIQPKQNALGGNGLSVTSPVGVGVYPIVTANDVNLLVDSTVPRQVNLPAPTTKWKGYIWDVSGLAASNNITLHPNGGEKINGVAGDFRLFVNGGVWLVITDETDWYVALLNVGGPTLSGSVVSNSPASQLIASIPLLDDTVYLVEYVFEVRDTGINRAEWIDSLTVQRLSGSVSVFGGSKGPAPVNPALGATLNGQWIVPSFSSTNFTLSLVTADAAHLNVNYDVFLTGRRLSAAAP